MPRDRELTIEEQVSIQTLRESGFSFQQIGQQIGCSKSTAFKVCKKYEETGSVEKRQRSGRCPKFAARTERIVCPTARQLEITSIVNRQFPGQNASMNLIRKILHKYSLRSHPRQRKPYVSVKNRQYRVEWAKAMQNWYDVIFSDECRFGLHNDSGVLRVWRSSQEASNPAFFQLTFTNYVLVLVWASIGPHHMGNLIICQ